MVAVCFFPSAFAVLSDIGPAGEKNVAVSFCIPLAFLCGGGILPTVIGTIGDYYSLGAGIITAGCLMVLASLCAVRLITKVTQ
jgi:NNP family nitrate/nitrite transporter-like MFS transporter